MEPTTSNGETNKKTYVTTKPKKQFDWEMLKKHAQENHWRTLRVTIKLRDKLHAGKPAQLNAANAMLRARGLEDVVEAAEMQRPVEERASEVVDEGLCEFHRREDKPGIWWPTNNFKACIKENWSVLGYRKDATPKGKKKDGGKTMQGSRAAIHEGLFVGSADDNDMDYVYLGESPDGVQTAVAHTMGPKGPQSCIKRNEYVTGRVLVFDIKIARAIADKLPDESFADTLLHAQEHGIGANRSQGNGRFDIVSVEEI